MSRFSKILKGKKTEAPREKLSESEGIDMVSATARQPLRPSPESKKDTIWPRLLFFAQAAGSRVPRELREMLIWLRACGVEVTRVPGTARFKLTQGRGLRDAEWDEIRKEYLAPHRAAVKELLTWCEHGGIPIRSEVLGGQIIWLTGDPTWVPDPAKRRVAYTPDEVRAMAGAGPDEVRHLHQIKVEFDGGTVEDVSDYSRELVMAESDLTRRASV